MLKSLPLSLSLGLDWGTREEQVIVDFVDGEYSGETELLSWTEIAQLLEGKGRLSLRWEGFRLPVRVLVCPAQGVSLEIEFLGEHELRSMHRAIVERVLPRFLGQNARWVFWGASTSGEVDFRPEGMLYPGARIHPGRELDFVLVDANSASQVDVHNLPGFVSEFSGIKVFTRSPLVLV